MKKEIKTIIFDAEGVLFVRDWKKLKEKILKKHGFSILYSDYPKKIQKKYEGLSIGKSSFRDVIKGLSGKKEIEPILSDYEKTYKKCKKHNHELLDLINKLKKEYNLICLTNTNNFELNILHKQGIFKDFNSVYSSSELGLKKPSKKVFLTILKKEKLNPTESLFIDDGLENTKAAKAVGMNAIQFKDNKQLFEELKKIGIK